MLPILRDGLKDLAVASVGSNGTTVAMRRLGSFSTVKFKLIWNANKGLTVSFSLDFESSAIKMLI